MSLSEYERKSIDMMHPPMGVGRGRHSEATMDAEVDLPPCPFCGDDSALLLNPMNHRGQKLVECGECLSTVSLKNWIRRASPWRPISEAPRFSAGILLRQLGFGTTFQGSIADSRRNDGTIETCVTIKTIGGIEVCNLDEFTHFAPIPAPPVDSNQ